MNGSRTDVVPCGKCPACLQRRQTGWVFRLMQENMVSSSCHFITLTYDDQHLPQNEDGVPTLHKPDFQNFMKRLRKKTPKDIKLKYYACGEYGSSTHRPHMHAIIFNLSMWAKESFLESTWDKGFIRVDEGNPETMHYVTKYMMKKSYKDKHLTIQPEFSLMSKKMGINYLTPQMYNWLTAHQKPYLTIENGQKIPIPRYFRDKLFTKEEKAILREQSLQYIEDNDPFKNEHHKMEYIKNQFVQNEKKDQLDRTKL